MKKARAKSSRLAGRPTEEEVRHAHQDASSALEITPESDQDHEKEDALVARLNLNEEDREAQELASLLESLAGKRREAAEEEDAGHRKRGEPGEGWPQVDTRWLESPLPGLAGDLEPKKVAMACSGKGVHFMTGKAVRDDLPAPVVTRPSVVRAWERQRGDAAEAKRERGSYLRTAMYKTPTAMEVPAHIPSMPSGIWDGPAHPFQGADPRLRHVLFGEQKAVPYHLPDTIDA